jgi:L-ascorbate metabolism protein UlaG (beta-lactamase superfamily)
MICYLAVLGVLPIVALDTVPKITIRWHGQSFFEVESSKGTHIVFDPHAIEAYGRKSVAADLVLISHLHNDHTQIGVIKDSQKARILFGLKGSGKNTEWNLADETFRDVHIQSVGVYHDTSEGMERGKNTVFIMEVDGLRMVHLGDLGHLLTDKQVKSIGPVDVLMIPVGGVYTINGSDAKKVVEQLKPRKFILPMHYGTPVYDAVLPADEFLDEQKNVKKYQGNTLAFETTFTPAEPIIAVVDWRN